MDQTVSQPEGIIESRNEEEPRPVGHNVFYYLLAFRLANALIIRTFFQPDEYYQSLEPAWQTAFGEGSGAWITWEWRNQLRSALHPSLFAICYRTAHLASQALNLDHATRTEILLVAPKLLQAFIAACGDYYTYKLGQYVYGKDSKSAKVALVLSTCSAWNWFCSTRTFSNCLETTLTVAALYNWPTHWALGVDEVGYQVDGNILRVRETSESPDDQADETTHLRRAILCAAFATILRPTNAIIWLTLVAMTFGRGIWVYGMPWEITALLKEGLVCSGSVLAITGLIDRSFFGFWTFPPWNFLNFNVFQSLAVFYGNNDWHYYLSQGYPLLLLTMLVPACFGLYEALTDGTTIQYLSLQSKLVLHRLAVISLVLPATLSLLSHKEVRFIYPVLPALHILAVPPLMRYTGLITGRSTSLWTSVAHLKSPLKLLLALVFLLNAFIAYYFSFVHNSGLIQATDYIRHEFEQHYLFTLEFHSPSQKQHSNLTFAVLMPCHSLPWRSHLQYPPTTHTPGISGWALTCEPPLNLTPAEKQTYLDEADIFYADPVLWFKRNMSRDIPLSTSQQAGIYAKNDNRKTWTRRTPPEDGKRRGSWLNEAESGSLQARGVNRAWPDYLLFFEQLEPTMLRVLEGSAYVECRRFFNTRFHDDSRRRGDVVVWCLNAEGYVDAK